MVQAENLDLGYSKVPETQRAQGRKATAATSRRYQSTFAPNRTMRGEMMVVGNPNELPDT